VRLWIERRLAEAQRELQVRVRGKRLIEVDERNGGVVADGRMIPDLERLAVLGERRGVLRVLEQPVPLLEQGERLLLRLRRNALGPRSVSLIRPVRRGLGARGGRQRQQQREHCKRFRGQARQR